MRIIPIGSLPGRPSAILPDEATVQLEIYSNCRQRRVSTSEIDKAAEHSLTCDWCTSQHLIHHQARAQAQKRRQ